MFFRKYLLGLALILVDLVGQPCHAEEPLSPVRFNELFRLIRPQATESKWREVPWLTSVAEARQKAAAEGKPIFIWSGGGCPPLGSC